MVRRFEPYDPAVIKKEFMDLPADDAVALKVAMKSYQMDLGSGYRLENYGDGLMMLTDSGRGQGRCLFFRRERSPASEIERLVAVLIYKKESQRVPAHVVSTARKRIGGAQDR